jgi:hypothetical protein
MEKCIFCSATNNDETVEHIVPRSLGNLHYILPKGKVCFRCNNKFARYESKVLSSYIFLEERQKFGLLSVNFNSTGHSLPADAMRKFLLKMGYESLYRSKNKIWQGIDFQSLLNFLNKGTDHIIFTEKFSSDPLRFKSIPGWIERFRLRNNHLMLEYAHNHNRIYFRFQFGSIRSQIRLS